MEFENARMLTEGIAQVSTSRWRAQAFVVMDVPKPRIVIHYSLKINRPSSRDAFPFANMQNPLDQAAENTVFSKLDLKSAYHQNPLQRKYMPFTSFEVNGRLFEFTKDSFWGQTL